MVAQRAKPTLRIGRAAARAAARRFPAGDGRRRSRSWRGWWRRTAPARRTVADLFCGVGPFALRLAERARIIAADNDQAAIAALQRAATGTQGLKPIEALARDLFRRPFVPVELKRFDAVVFDPPRQGAEAQARELAASASRDRGRGLVQSRQPSRAMRAS